MVKSAGFRSDESTLALIDLYFRYPPMELADSRIRVDYNAFDNESQLLTCGLVCLTRVDSIVDLACNILDTSTLLKILKAEPLKSLGFWRRFVESIWKQLAVKKNIKEADALQLLDYTLDKVDVLCIDKRLQNAYHTDCEETEQKLFKANQFLVATNAHWLNSLGLSALNDRLLDNYKKLDLGNIGLYFSLFSVRHASELLKGELGSVAKAAFMDDTIDLFQKMERLLYQRWEDVKVDCAKKKSIKPKLTALAHAFVCNTKHFINMLLKVIQFTVSSDLTNYIHLQQFVIKPLVDKLLESRKAMETQLNSMMGSHYASFSIADENGTGPLADFVEQIRVGLDDGYKNLFEAWQNSWYYHVFNAWKRSLVISEIATPFDNAIVGLYQSVISKQMPQWLKLIPLPSFKVWFTKLVEFVQALKKDMGLVMYPGHATQSILDHLYGSVASHFERWKDQDSTQIPILMETLATIHAFKNKISFETQEWSVAILCRYLLEAIRALGAIELRKPIDFIDILGPKVSIFNLDGIKSHSRFCRSSQG